MTARKRGLEEVLKVASLWHWRSFVAALFVHAVVALVLPAQASRAPRSDTIVRTAPALDAPPARLVREWAIGEGNPQREYEFDKLADLLPTASGLLWVIDSKGGPGEIFTSSGSVPPLGHFVRVYGADGKFVRYVGRRGAGPGEWGTPNSLHPMPDGRVLLSDGSLANRLAFYREDGSYDTTWTYPRRYVRPAPDAHGFIWATTIDAAASGPGRGPATTPFQRVVLGRAGELIGDAPPAPPVVELPRKSVLMGGSNGRGRGSVEAPYQPRTLSVIAPQGYWVTARTDRYAVDLHITTPASDRPGTWREGDSVVSIRRDAPLVEISSDEQRYLRAGLEARATRLGGSLNGTGIEVPSVKPPISTIRFDYDGRIWIRVAMPSERAASWREPEAYDVYRADGTFIGRVEFPANVVEANWMVAARGNLLWLPYATADGVHAVARYRIVW